MALIGLSSDVFDLPCKCKPHFEAKAVDELLRIDELEKSCGMFTKARKTLAWSDAKTPAKLQETKPSTNEGLEDMYRLLTIEDRNSKFQTEKERLLTAWQVCDSQLEHDGGYLQKDAWKENKKPNSPTKKETKVESLISSVNKSRSSSAKLKVLVESKKKRCEFFSENLNELQAVEAERQDGRVSRLGRLASPHKVMKFHHFHNTNEYMKYYRDIVTSAATKKHIRAHLEKTRKKPLKKSNSYSAPKEMTFYKFRVSNGIKDDKSGFGILRVSPCPATIKGNSKKGQKEKATKEIKFSGEKVIRDSKTVSLRGAPNNCNPPKGGIILKKQENFRFSLSSGLNCATKPQPMTTAAKIEAGKAFYLSANCADIEKKIEPEKFAKAREEIRPIEAGGMPLKKVELQVYRAPIPSGHGVVGVKGRSAGSRPKSKTVQGVLKVTPKALPVKVPSDFGMPPKALTSEKEFLHITSPKIITTNSTGTNSKPSGEFDSNSTFYTFTESQDGIPRGRMIDVNKLFLQQETQAPFNNSSDFRACITPTGYPSVGTQIHRARPIKPSTHDTGVDMSQSDANIIERIPSKPSVSNIGPFM